MTFNVGAPVGPDAIRVESADLPSLRLTGLPADSDVDISLTFTPLAQGEVAAATVVEVVRIPHVSVLGDDPAAELVQQRPALAHGSGLMSRYAVSPSASCVSMPCTA